MRLRHIKGSEEIIKNSIYCIHPEVINNEYQKINLNKIFNNNNPTHIELGMGKGKFICQLANNNSNINYIGIEKYATVILKSLSNYKNLYLSTNKQNINLFFMCVDVKNIINIFEKNSIEKIYLNFSDPWPKKNHANRRLTSIPYLNIYQQILKQNGLIEFKTDNLDLFEFSIKQIEIINIKIVNCTYDLHNDNIMNENNIMTEYEQKFSQKGNKIYKLVAQV